VIDDCDFDEARSDVEPDCRLLATEERHGVAVVEAGVVVRRCGESGEGCVHKGRRGESVRRPCRRCVVATCHTT
jgi:hypothetical protein